MAAEIRAGPEVRYRSGGDREVIYRPTTPTQVRCSCRVWGASVRQPPIMLRRTILCPWAGSSLRLLPKRRPAWDDAVQHGDIHRKQRDRRRFRLAGVYGKLSPRD